MHGPSEPSPPAGLLRVDELIDRFEDEWANGQRPVIARFLQQAPGGALDATQLALELCVIDLCARWRFSCSNEGDSDNNDDFPLRPFTEDYLARFPEVAQDGLAPLALVREEYVARVTCDGPVDHQEYVDRFPQIADSLLRSLREFDRSEQQTKLRAELQKLARNQRQQFLDDYEVLERLGTGGMGIVYRARQISLNRIVALKTIRRGEFASDQEVQRFLAEARTVATLDHPNIVSVYDVGSQDGQHYYAMAYVEGDSLAELIRCGPLPAREAATLCYKLTLGVEYAHSRGIIHRDLKPGNILIDREGSPRIADFGLAKEIAADSEITRTGQLLGTPAFMPPEQADGGQGPATERSDVYSLGAVLYAMLTGRPPFQADGPMATIREVLESDPITPRKLNHKIPQDLETICIRCLSKDPSARYESAQHLGDDLCRYLDDRPIRARSVTRTERLLRWRRRNPALASAIATIAVILIVSTSVALWYALRVAELAQLEADARVSAVREQSRSIAASGVLRLEDGDTSGLHDLIESLAVLGDRDSPRDSNLERSRLRLANAWVDEIPTSIEAVFSHQGRLLDAVFSMDERHIITATSGLELRVWDADSGLPITVPLRHESESTLKKIVAGDSLDTFVSIDQSGLAYLWSIRSAAALASLSGDGWRGVGVADGSRFVASARQVDGKTLVTVYRTATFERLYDFQVPATVECMAMANKRSSLAVAMSDGTLAVFELSGDDAVESFRTTANAEITQMQFGPDEKLLATVGEDDIVTIWQEDLAAPLATIHHNEDVYVLAFSHDGQLCASGGFDSQLRVCNLATGELQYPPIHHDGPVLTAQFSADGTKLVTGGYGSNVNVWDPLTGKSISRFMQHQGVVQSVHVSSRDPSQLLSASRDGTSRLWRTQMDKPRTTMLQHSNRVWSLDFNGDGSQLVVACENGDVHQWNTESVSQQHELLEHPTTLIAARFHPINGNLVTATNAGSMRIWKKNTDAVGFAEVPLSQAFRYLDLSPSGEFVIVGCDSPQAFLIDIKKLPYRAKAIPHPQAVQTVAFAADGRTFATGCDDGVVRIWNAVTCETLGEPVKHRGPVTAICFSPDGAYFASASEYDRTVRVWDCKTWTPLDYALLPKSFAQEMAFAPNSRVLATASSNGEVRLWDVDSGLPCGLPIQHGMLATCVRFSPDGRWLATGSFDGTVHLRQLPTWFDSNNEETTRKRIWRSIGIRRDGEGIEHSLDWREWQELQEQGQASPAQ